jgi:thymidylate kinase
VRRRGRPWSVLIVGPDGAGKSTVADLLVFELKQRGVHVTRRHYRPNVLFRRNGQADASVPHAASRRSAASAFMKVAATWMDVAAGEVLLRRSNAHTVISERGWYDQEIDPERYRLPDSVTPIVKLFGRVLPKADVVVVASADAEIAAKRKGELSAQVYGVQADAWTQLASRVARRAYVVPTALGSRCTDRYVRALADALCNRAWQLRRIMPSPRRLELTASGSLLDLYRPMTRRARAAGAVATFLDVFRTGSVTPDPLMAVVAHVAGVCDVQQVTAFAGSGRTRRVVGFGSEGQLTAVAKVSQRGSDPGLLHESKVLRVLDGRVAEGIVVPRVLVFRSLPTHDILVTKPSRATTIPKNDWRRVASVCVALQCHPKGPFVHGDLAPWNLGMDSDRLCLMDFENCSNTSAPLRDLVHYVVSVGGLLSALSVRDAAALLTNLQGPPLSVILSSLPLTPEEVPLTVIRELGSWDPNCDRRRQHYARRLRAEVANIAFGP